MSREDTQLLEIYLDDHWAGASAGRSLSKRMFRNNRGTEWADRLGWLVSQIEEDDTTLSRVRAALGIDGGKLKRTLALAGERISRLKLNGRIFGYSPLSRLLECEAMEAGVSAKKRLWSAMLEGPHLRPELAEFDFQQLVDRANEQLELIRSFHSHAAARALNGATDEAP